MKKHGNLFFRAFVRKEQAMSSEADTVIREDPLSRIRSEFPEFCSFISTARRMSIDPNDVDSVMGSVRKMVATLLLHDQQDVEPNVFERAGVDRLLFAMDSCATSYAAEIEGKTKRIRDACLEFERAVTEMENLKKRVLNAYSDSMREFDEILRRGSEMTLDPSILTEMLDPRGTERPRSPFTQWDEEEENDRVSHGDLSFSRPPSPFIGLSNDEDDDDSLSMPSIIQEVMDRWEAEEREQQQEQEEASAVEVPPVMPQNSADELESFFEENNTPIITGDVDASTRAPIVSIEVEKIEKKIEDAATTSTEEKKKKKRAQKRKRTTNNEEEEVTVNAS